MSLFEDLKTSIKGKEENKKVKYINLPKLDGKVEDTPENRKLIEDVKAAGVGNGAVLSANYFACGDGFDIYKFEILTSCFDRKLEENYLFARSYYGITTYEGLIPEVKHFLTEHDRSEAFAGGFWSDELFPIHSFEHSVKLLPHEIQPMRFRFDSAIFRAADNGGVVYELAPNEKIVNIQHNAFTIEKTEVSRTNYAVVTADNQPLTLADDFKGVNDFDTVEGQVHLEM